MRTDPDKAEIAAKLRGHIKGQAASNMPPPVSLSVYDGSRQFEDGYVWALHGDKRVQCIAPGPLDLTAATPAAQIVITALPPNPDEPGGSYFLIGGGISGTTNSRAPALMTTGITIVGGGSGTGTVTSVAISVTPTGIFDVSGSPITTAGTITISMDNQSANTVLSGPTSGGAATPAFRALVAGDIPSLPASIITSGQLALARGGTGADLSGTGAGFLKQATTGANVTVATLASGDIPDISATYIPNALVAAKGDIIAASANDTPVIRSVGSNNQVLIADSAQTSGLNWTTTPVSSLFQHYADAGNTTTSETDLYSDTTPASTFANNGDVINALYSGVFVSSATATRQLKAYFGGTAIYDSGALSISVADSWQLTISIIRESSTVVRCIVDLKVGGVSVTSSPTYTRITGLTLSGTNILKITGTAAGVGAATNDIVAKSGVVLLPASASALGANTALSNLASTAVNTDINPSGDFLRKLGSAAIKWIWVATNEIIMEQNGSPSIGTPAAGDSEFYIDLENNFRQINSTGIDDIHHRGDYSGAAQFSIGTSETAMITKSIKANSLSTKGWIHTRTTCTVLNAAGANRTHSHTYNFGAYAFVIAPSTAQATNASSRRVYILDVWTYNDQAQNSQIHVYHYVMRGAAAAATAPAAAVDDMWGWDTSAITTTSNVTVSQTIKSNNATGTQTAYSIGRIVGPYSGS